MKTLIIGAGPLGSLYAYLFQKANKDVTLLARNEHYKHLKTNGIALINEFTGEKIKEKVKVTNKLNDNDEYDLAIIIMRKNSVKTILPSLAKANNIKNFLFMGNNASGFEEYLKYISVDKILFGFPGGGGSRVDHIVHYIDSEKPGGKRMPVTIGEFSGNLKERTQKIIELFETSEIPVKYIDDIDSWLKYHAVFVVPLAGALLEAGDNYKLAKDEAIIRTYIRSQKEGGEVLKLLGFTKSYNPKFNLIKMMPETVTIKILKKVFDSRFAEIAMMMHVNAAKDEMAMLGNEVLNLSNRAGMSTPNLKNLISSINDEKGN
jgi:2-dehydropantoate 2-reductase